MSRRPIYSIWGALNDNPDLLKNMQIPSVVDRDILQDNIVLECEGLSVLYTDPAFLESAITQWSKKMIIKWQKIADALALEYNPLENYRRNETTTGMISRSGTKSRAGSGSKNNSESASDSRNVNSSEAISNSEEGSSTNKVNGMDSPTSLTLTDHDKTETDRAGAQNTTGVESSSGNASRSASENTASVESENDNSTDQDSRSTLVFGNIGTLTSQAMLTSELSIRENWNIYSTIIQDFKNQFCLLVY